MSIEASGVGRRVRSLPHGGHGETRRYCFILFGTDCASLNPRQRSSGEVSPPFKGGVAGMPDYLMFTKLISRPGWLICHFGRFISFI